MYPSSNILVKTDRIYVLKHMLHHNISVEDPENMAILGYIVSCSLKTNPISNSNTIPQQESNEKRPVSSNRLKVSMQNGMHVIHDVAGMDYICFRFHFYDNIKMKNKIFSKIRQIDFVMILETHMTTNRFFKIVYILV